MSARRYSVMVELTTQVGLAQVTGIVARQFREHDDLLEVKMLSVESVPESETS